MFLQRIAIRAVPNLLAQCRVVRRNNRRVDFIHRHLFHSTQLTCSVRLFSDKHEWVEVNGKIGVVGISKHAEEALGDIVFVQLPEPNAELKCKDECGTLESVKAASELYTPVSGKVLEVNNQLEDNPSLINSSCYEKGWLFKIEISNEAELQKLMTEDQYNTFLRTDTDNH